MFTPDLVDQITKAGVVAVLTIDSPVDAVPVARALKEGGITAIELTFRTSRAAESLALIREHLPEMLVGAGTILNRDQLKVAAEAGAQFAVAPGCNPNTIRAAKEMGLPFGPGICTPTDIEIAIELGCNVLKYFPAETSGGLVNLTIMAAPFAHLGIRYIPLGGVTSVQLANYLASPLVAAVGGSWLAKPEVIKRRDFKEISIQAAGAMNVVRSARRA